MSPTINGQNVSYIAYLRRAERSGDALRRIIPDAGVSGNGSVIYRGRVIGTFTMLGESIVDRKGYSVPASDPDGVRAFFRRAVAAA